jgi:hypothetical protein
MQTSMGGGENEVRKKLRCAQKSTPASRTSNPLWSRMESRKFIEDRSLASASSDAAAWHGV